MSKPYRMVHKEPNFGSVWFEHTQLQSRPHPKPFPTCIEPNAENGARYTRTSPFKEDLGFLKPGVLQATGQRISDSMLQALKLGHNSK